MGWIKRNVRGVMRLYFMFGHGLISLWCSLVNSATKKKSRS